MHLKKLVYKGMAASVICAIVASMILPGTIYAAEPDSQQAAENKAVSTTEMTTEKEEVVYVNLKGDGTVSDVNVVNCFEPDRARTIVDYGVYSNVRNMTTEDKIVYKDGKITVEGVTEKLYYQGTMENMEIPWDIQIRYYLDGKELSPEELAGKSGRLKITFHISENTSCQGAFFDGYALQMSFTMDTALTKNILSEGATIANVGSDKQITYTILPGKGADYELTADVTEFEMSEIAINGVRLNLDVDVDDEELMEQIAELQDGIRQIDDGSQELADGASKLQDGLEELNGKSKELTEGSGAMKAALQAISTALSGVSDVSGKVGDLVDASAGVKAGIKEAWDGSALLQSKVSYEAYKALMQENGLNIDELTEGNSQASGSLSAIAATLGQQAAAMQAQAGELNGNANQLESQAAELEAQAGQSTDEEQAAELRNQAAALRQQAAQLRAQAEQLNQNAAMLQTQSEQLAGTATLLNGNNAALAGLETYLTAVNRTIAEFVNGMETLYNQYQQFDQGIQQLAASVSDMLHKMSALTEAVSEMVDEYSKLDRGIRQYTDGVKEVLSGMRELVTGSGDLTDGTNKLREETVDMDREVSDQIEELLDEISGEQVPTESFVSDKNTNVESVQFVIKTTAITVPEEEEEVEAKQPEETFVEKLIHLFKK